MNYFVIHECFQKWAIGDKANIFLSGDQENSPIIESEETNATCPQDVTTWTYVSGSEVRHYI